MELNDIQDYTKDNLAVMLYFYNDNCAPCKVLRPKVQELVENSFPKMKFVLINAEQFPSTAASLGVFASPTIISFFEGKEYIRESKNISISELYDKIDRIYSMIF